MNRSDEVTIQVSDLEDVRNVLSACLNLLQARDLIEAQVAYTAVQYSPLTNEAARVAQRFDGYMGDYLLNAHEAENDAVEEDPNEDTSEGVVESQEGSESVTEDIEELVRLPLGAPKMPKQAGRRVPANRKKKLAETQGEEVEHAG